MHVYAEYALKGESLWKKIKSKCTGQESAKQDKHLFTMRCECILIT